MAGPQAAPSLAADPVAVVGRELCLSHPVVWTLQNGFSHKNDDVLFRDNNGRILFTLAHKNWSDSFRRVLVDASGTALCCHARKGLLPPKTFLCRGGVYNAKHVIADIASSAPVRGGQLQVTVHRGGNQVAIFDIVFSCARRSFSVQTWSGRTIARCENVTADPGALGGLGGYQVAIEPGVDVAFIALLLCYVDQRGEEERRKRSDTAAMLTALPTSVAAAC